VATWVVGLQHQKQVHETCGWQVNAKQAGLRRMVQGGAGWRRVVRVQGGGWCGVYVFMHHMFREGKGLDLTGSENQNWRGPNEGERTLMEGGHQACSEEAWLAAACNSCDAGCNVQKTQAGYRRAWWAVEAG